MSEDVKDIFQFATSSAFKTAINNGTSISGFTEDRIKSMIQSPSKNGSNLAMASKTAKTVNGSYKRIINYMSSVLTFDHFIYPVYEDVLKAIQSKDEGNLEHAQTSIALDRYKLKYNLPIFTEKLFTYGAIFLYKLEDKKSIAFQEFDLSMCRISYISDGVFRYQIDVSKIKADEIPYYPKEIQNAVNTFQNGGAKENKKFVGNFYQVSDKGVAFSLDVEVLNQVGVSIPPFSSVLADVIKVEKSKAKMEDKDEVDNAIIIHSQVPLDDKGVPTIELGTVKKYNNELKKGLPNNVYAITNPFNAQTLNMRGTGQMAQFGLLHESAKEIYKGSGVSPMLFAEDTNSSQALERSIQTDIQWLYSFLLPMFENFVNFELASISKKSNATWHIKMVHSSYFTKKDDVAVAKEQLSFGGSRMEYLALTGLTPIEVVNLLVFEQQVVDIDSIMVVKQNSNTLSSNDEKGGRPQVDNPTDKTIDIKDGE